MPELPRQPMACPGLQSHRLRQAVGLSPTAAVTVETTGAACGCQQPASEFNRMLVVGGYLAGIFFRFVRNCKLDKKS